MSMTQPEIEWSSAEKKLAEAAIKKAYSREIESLIKYVRENASNLSQIEEIWQLHDFLSASRHNIDGKYDYRESFLIFTLSRLINEELLDNSELEGLTADKQAKVSVLARM